MMCSFPKNCVRWQHVSFVSPLWHAPGAYVQGTVSPSALMHHDAVRVLVADRFTSVQESVDFSTVVCLLFLVHEPVGCQF